jgi:hypothetical protein
MGGAGQSHKKIDPDRSWIMHQYYTNRVRIVSHPSYGQLTNFFPFPRLFCSSSVA